MTLEAMRNRLNAIRAELTALNDAEGNFAQSSWDTLTAEAEKLTADIEAIQARAKQLDKLNDTLDTPVSRPVNTHSNIVDLTPKDKNEMVFNSLGEQLMAVAKVSSSRTSINYPVDQAINKLNRVAEMTNAVTVREGANVGYLVQTQFSDMLREKAIETGVLASRVSRQPIGAEFDSFTYMELMNNDLSKGVYNGGIPVYRKSEGDSMTLGKGFDFEERSIALVDLYGMLKVSNQALRDVVALTGLINRTYPKSFGFKLDTEIFEGTGVKQCLGIMNSPALVTVAKETNQTAGTITVANLAKMRDRMPIGNRANAVWLVGEGVEPQLQTLLVGQTPAYMQPGGLSNSPYATLYGRPVIPIEQCEPVGSKGDIVLADLSQYLLIEKGGTQIDTSIHVYFVEDETAFRFIQRNNGQPFDAEAYTPMKGTLKRSPFVTLAARS